MRSTRRQQTATGWRRVLLGAALLATMLPVTGCATLTPAFFACLFSTSSSSDSCHVEALAPGPPLAPTGMGTGYHERGLGDFLVQLGWTRSPDPDVRGYDVYRSATSGGPYDKVASSAHISGISFLEDLEFGEPDSDFGPCTTAYYVLRTIDWIFQESPDSAEASAATPCWGPAVLTGLTATPRERRVHLDWDDTNAPDLAGYDIYRGLLSPRAGFVELVKLNAEPMTASEYDDVELSGATEYVYRVAAVYQGNRSGRSGVVSAIPDVSQRYYLGDLTATPGDASVRLEWDDTVLPDAVGFNVYRSRTMFGSQTKVNEELVTDLTYVDRGLENTTEYFYRLTSFSRSGVESDPSSIVSATPFEAKPDAPTGLTATPRHRSVYLDWDDRGAPGLAGHNLYRAEHPSGPFSKVNSELVVDSQTLVEELVNGTEYFFQVTAVDGTGDESDPSAIVAATPAGADAPPAAPTGLTATHGGEDVWLDWDDNREADLAGYNVYEWQQATGRFGKLDSVKASEYLVLETPNIEFRYYVTAVDQAGQESAPSEIARAVPCPPSGCAVAMLRRGTTSASPGPDNGWFPFELAVTGDYREGGRSRVEDGRLVGHGFVYEGAFELKAPSRLPAAGLGGTWRSTTDWVLEPAAGKGSATGVALATFADPEAGQACLRFEETFTAKQNSKGARVATQGTFTLLGGTGEAAKQLGKGTHRVSVQPDGRVTYEGNARAVQGAVPALPAECQALGALPSSRLSDTHR